MPLVAIATPVFNGEKYLAKTMECVQALDYPNLVHVVQDNASTDATPDIIARFEGRRVPVLSERSATTRPMADNWNAVVRRVPEEASYFWLLCADDILAPHAIGRLVEVAQSSPDVQLVGCQWRADGLCGEELPKERSIFAGDEMLRRYFRRETMVLSGMNVLFRRSLIRPDADFYDPTIISFDTDANIRACALGKYGFVHEELLYWRQHEGSTTQTVSGRDLSYHAEWLLLLDRHFSHALGHREYLHCRDAFRRHFLRRLLMLRIRPGGKEICDRHLRALRLRGDEAGLPDFAAALADWVLHAVRGRRAHVGAPRRRFPDAAAGLGTSRAKI
ncbi:glycosyltransferase [Roseomonas eburnea]|uniref:Glycosyltransferase n=1 Tax=Neoroseomonas eburnea TaxID=1346889 RepID=A0A9X9X5S8_9PROT|nr:glycosyltransferase [Neoroseomonas eburnea]MBR0679064.1 glycosyltransferase [Neoroseomonas eburnea]